MQVAIKSPSNPLLPPAANQLWISDNWSNSLGEAPVFAYKIQYVEGELTTDLKYENVSMTDEQWQKWAADSDDEQYILECLVSNLGLEFA
jgi:hypothetical protein